MSKKKDDVLQHDNSYKKLCEFIGELYGEDINWKWITRQIKTIKAEYNLTYLDMRLILKYATQYEDVIVDNSYGLGQFFPRYIDDALAFAQTIINNKEKAREMGDLVEPRVVCRGRDKRRKFKER